MVPPDSPAALLSGRASGFPFPGWEREFGPYSYFFVAGHEALPPALQQITASELVRVRPTVPEQVPGSWRREFPSLDWNQFSRVQRDKIRRGEPARFDKAAMYILNLLAYASDSELDLSKFQSALRIEPAVYVLDGLDERLARAMTVNMQPTDILYRETILELSRYYPVTFDVANEVSEFIMIKVGRRFPVRMIRGRNDQGRAIEKRANFWTKHFID